MVRTHARAARQVHGGGAGGIPGMERSRLSCCLSLSLTLIQVTFYINRSLKFSNANPPEVGCHYTKAKAINPQQPARVSGSSVRG